MFKSLTKIFQRGQAKAIVLCYHRVAHDNIDPWELAVSPLNFEQQLRMLRKKFSVIPVAELIADTSKRKGDKAVCITFDDGYTDNYTAAKPLLEKYNSPACFFIASAYTGKRQLFWWDELTDIVLRTETLPATLHLPLGKEEFTFDNAAGVVLTCEQIEQLSTWRAKKPAVHKRCELYLQLWQAIRLLNAEEIKLAMQGLRDWSGYIQSEDLADRVPMSETQLRNLSQSPLFTIGLHTANHLALAAHPTTLQEEEVKQNKAELQRVLQKPVETMSFPYGKYNDDTLRVIRQHEIVSAFASEKKVTTKHTDKSHIGRFAVGNWSGEKLERKLENWFATR